MGSPPSRLARVARVYVEAFGAGRRPVESRRESSPRCGWREGVIAHPLNRPSFDPAAGRVTEGYGILQPRISVTFTSAVGSLFARLYSGHTGVDPYTTAVSDTYQDLFGEGIFTRKGLYDVDAFTAALADAVPENALLSHDLFEGLHARAALVSDIELVDEYPSTVLAHARRQHRWIRGDWQILLWLFPFVPTRHGVKRNPFSLISRWKILDNLRRVSSRRCCSRSWSRGGPFCLARTGSGRCLCWP